MNVSVSVEHLHGSEIALSADSAFSGVSYQAIASSFSITLPSGVGEKTVYAIIKNSCGMTSILTDSITLTSTEDASSQEGSEGNEDGESGDDEEEGEVLGVKLYADGTLLRGYVVKIFEIIEQKKKHIKNLAELARYYRGLPIINVSDEDLEAYADYDTDPVAVRELAPGTLVKGSADAIYLITTGGKKQQITDFQVLQSFGNAPILTITDYELNSYPTQS